MYPFCNLLFQGHIVEAFKNLSKAVPYLIMPAVTISLFSLSRNARLVRSSMLEVLSQDFVRTARAKGVSERGVVIRHALRNAWLPVVTMIGLEFGFLLSGVVVVETVFSWPGVGRLVFNAINQRDIPLVQAAVIMFALLFVLLNLFRRLVLRPPRPPNPATVSSRPSPSPAVTPGGTVPEPSLKRAERGSELKKAWRSLLRAKWPLIWRLPFC